MTKFPMTAAGYSTLQDELNQRMAVTRPRLIQRMQEAIADGNIPRDEFRHRHVSQGRKSAGLTPAPGQQILSWRWT